MASSGYYTTYSPDTCYQIRTRVYQHTRVYQFDLAIFRCSEMVTDMQLRHMMSYDSSKSCIWSTLLVRTLWHKVYSRWYPALLLYSVLKTVFVCIFTCRTVQYGFFLEHVWIQSSTVDFLSICRAACARQDEKGSWRVGEQAKTFEFRAVWSVSFLFVGCLRTARWERLSNRGNGRKHVWIQSSMVAFLSICRLSAQSKLRKALEGRERTQTSLNVEQHGCFPFYL